MTTQSPDATEQVERVARAICRAHWEYEGLPEDEVADQVSTNWQYWEDEARAAIAAMEG